MRIPGVVTAIAVPVAVLGLVGGVVLAAEGQFRSSESVHSAATAESTGTDPQPVAPAPAAAAAPDAAAAQPGTSTARRAGQTAPAAKPATAGLSLAEYASYQRGIIRTVDTWWVSALSRAGVRYSGPRLVVAAPGKSAMSKCGRAVANPADSKKAYPAFYCRGDKTVYLASGWMHGAIYARYHKGGVAAIVAHEFGHHIQHTIGIADPKVSKQELQADCLAGIWVRAAVGNGSLNANDVADARRALRALGDTETSSKLHHGTANERSAWFDRGYRSGDAYVCNHF